MEAERRGAVADHLAELERFELAALVRASNLELLRTPSAWRPARMELVVRCPASCLDAFKYLAKTDKKRLVLAVARTGGDARELEGPGAEDLVRFEVDPAAAADESTQLLADLMAQRGVMVAVGTGGPQINDVEDYYRLRRKRVNAALESIGIKNSNPFDSLWEWFRYYKEHLPSYSERRLHLPKLFAPMIEAVAHAPPPLVPLREPTGWVRVDRATSRARELLRDSSAEEDYQTVGLVCREILISVGQAVFDPGLHPPADGIAPSKTDAKRLIEAFVASSLQGA